MIEPIIAAIAIALLSLTGGFLFGAKHIAGTHRFIIPAAMGVFLGVIFFELIPETLEANELYGAIAIVTGFLAFYLLSHIIKTYHHHHHEDENANCEHKKSRASRLMIGDTVHNIADGIVIASAFFINPAVGIAATIGIALHEVPQEIAEYAVLISAGYTKRKALFLNFVSAISILVGVVLSYVFIAAGDYLWILTGLAAGNLLYITASDMIPELNEHEHGGHFLPTFLSTIAGLILIALLLHSTH